MEYLEYLIRVLTYQRSSLELKLKEFKTNIEGKNVVFGEIKGIDFALDKTWSLINELDNEN